MKIEYSAAAIHHTDHELQGDADSAPEGKDIADNIATTWVV